MNHQIEIISYDEYKEINNNFEKHFTFLQSHYWSNLCEKLKKGKYCYYVLKKDNKPVICAQVLFSNIEKLKPFNIVQAIMYDGPVILHDDYEQFNEGYKIFCKKVEKSIRNRNNAIKFTITDVRQIEFKDVYMRNKFKNTIWGTLILELQGTEELISLFKSSGRKQVKKAIKLGLSCKKIKSFEQFKNIFIKNYIRFEFENGRECINDLYCEEYLKTIWTYGEENKLYRYYIVIYDNQVYATLGCYIYNNIATEIMSSMSKAVYSNKIPAQDYIHYYVINDCIENNINKFDFAGVSPNPSNNKEIGIRRFKEKFGGEYIDLMHFEKDFSISLKIFKFFKKHLRKG